jgi:uncharacterized protein (TIGR02284 family)
VGGVGGHRSAAFGPVKLKLVGVNLNLRRDLMSPEKTLDRLISVAVDSQKRYHHAARDVGKEVLTRFFNQQSAIRQRHADELQLERDRMGVKKKESGSVAGALDTAAMDFSVVMSMGDTGVVNWCRQDADAAAKEYQQALQENPSPQLRAVLQRHLSEILATVVALEQILREYGGPRS